MWAIPIIFAAVDKYNTAKGECVDGPFTRDSSRHAASVE
jgi:hypothetical protein